MHRAAFFSDMTSLKKQIRVLRIVGYSWVVVVGIYILLQYMRVLLTDGLPFGHRVLSLLNIWNLFFIFIALVPGLICILVADHFLGEKK